MVRSISKNKFICSIFTLLAPVYDHLDKSLTWRYGLVWRKKMLAAARVTAPQRILDACAGTGLLTAELVKIYGPKTNVIAIDYCPAMANAVRERLREMNLPRRVDVKVENVESMSFPDDFFDSVYVSFGMRFVSDVKATVCELCRVLKPGGRLWILELCHPPGFLRRKVVRWVREYLFVRQAHWNYKIPPVLLYPLHDALLHYPEPDKFSRVLGQVGLDYVKYKYLNWGLAVLHQATKNLPRQLAFIETQDYRKKW